MKKQYLRKETFSSYKDCEKFLEYYLETYGQSDIVVTFSITKVLDNDWCLVILYS